MKAADCEAALSLRYRQPEQAIFFNVPCQTGGGASRLADAVAMELWPSRGLALHAFEIKVNRYDWTRNELKNPAKAEKFFDLCDYFWMVTPIGIIKEGELPPGWGHIIVNEDKTSSIAVKAERKTKTREDIPRYFAASLFRSAHEYAGQRARQLIEPELKAAREIAQKEAESIIASRTPEAYQTLKNRHLKLLKCLGLSDEENPDIKWNLEPPERIAEFYKMFKEARVTGYYGIIGSVERALKDAQENIKKAMKPFEKMHAEQIDRANRKGFDY